MEARHACTRLVLPPECDIDRGTDHVAEGITGTNFQAGVRVGAGILVTVESIEHRGEAGLVPAWSCGIAGYSALDAGQRVVVAAQTQLCQTKQDQVIGVASAESDTALGSLHHLLKRPSVEQSEA